MEKVVLKVDGMSCEHCVKAVKGAAESVANVQHVKVDLKKGNAAFDYDGGAATLDAVKAAIKEQGYDVN